MEGFAGGLVRVCHVCSSLSAGGMARAVLELGERAPEGTEMDLVATAFPGIHWPAEGGAWRRRAVIGKGSRVSRYAALYRLLRAWRPHVVHAHQEAYAPIVARLARVPVCVETIHSAPFWRTLGHPVVRRLRRRCVTCHIAVSEGLRAELVERGELRAEEVAAIPNGVRPGRFREPRRTEAPILGTVARLDAGKGIAHLVRAFAGLRERWPGARLIVAGDGPERGAIEALVAELGLREAVELPGYVDDPRRVLRQLDLFVLPTLHEAFGLAIAEAMAEGVPVVATRLAGPASLCRHGMDGWLVPPGDPEALRAACERLLEDLDLRASLARTAWRRVTTEFTVDRMREAHAELYRRLLQARGARA